MKDIKEVNEKAKGKGLEFPLDAIINKAIKRALKQAMQEIETT